MGKREFTPKRALVSAAVYKALEDEVERLIGILDVLAPEPDLEPSLAWTNVEVAYGEYRTPPNSDDREADYDRGGVAMTADDEPLCGSVHCHGNINEAERNCNPWNQVHWAQGNGEVGNECEIVTEDEGAQCDDEGDISDSGVGDMDGLHDVYGRAGVTTI